jgi:hypothetical protein
MCPLRARWRAKPRSHVVVGGHLYAASTCNTADHSPALGDLLSSQSIKRSEPASVDFIEQGRCASASSSYCPYHALKALID